MINIYEQGYENFASMGLGEIHPESCKIHEEQGGVYELELSHPMDEAGKYDLIMNGRVLRVPAPAKITPHIQMSEVESQEIWKTNAEASIYSSQSVTLGEYVTTTVPGSYSYDQLMFVTVYIPSRTTKKWVANDNRLLETLPAWTEVTILEKPNANYYLVLSEAGTSGYMATDSIYLDRTIPGVPAETVQAGKVRDQLFRIYRTEKDTENLSVKAWARHVYYDLLGVALTECNFKNKTVGEALAQINAAGIPNNHGFRFLTDSAATLSGVYTHKCMVEAHLDPDAGLLSAANLRVIRDNYDVFFVGRSTVKRAPISYAKNLIGVKLDINEDGITNRIIPVGTDIGGLPIYVDSVYVNSPRNDEATRIQARVIEYSDIKEILDEKTVHQVKYDLTQAALADFEKGIDLPDISVTVNFVQLGDTEEYQQYKNLDRLYLGDLVEVKDLLHGVELEAEVNEYDFDCLTQRYTDLRVGVTSARNTIGTVGSFMLPNGSIGGSKLIMGGVSGDRLENLSVKSAKIGNLAVQTAHIEDLAVTNAKISDAGIDYAKIKDLVAGTAIFTLGLSDKLYVGRLVVTDANLASATIGQLVVRDGNGKLWKISVAGDGEVSATEVTVDGQNISNGAVISISERLVYRQASAPSPAFVSQLWIDSDDEVLRRCVSTAPDVWEVVSAGEVHTSVIDVDDDGMTVASTGDINILAGGGLKIKALGDASNALTMDKDGIVIESGSKIDLKSGSSFNLVAGSGTNKIMMSNDNADGWFITAGSDTYASAPFRLKKDGSIYAKNLQQVYSQSFWDMSDNDYPAEFFLYIPTGYSIDSVVFSTKASPCRTFAKTAKARSGAVSGSSGINQTNNTTVSSLGTPHNHTMSDHTHSISAHTHDLEYGVNQADASSTNGIGTWIYINGTDWKPGPYYPDPGNLEIKNYVSSGWNTLRGWTNLPAKISGFVTVKLTAT